MVDYYSEECLVAGFTDLPATIRGEVIPSPNIVIPFFPGLLYGIPDSLFHAFAVSAELLSHGRIQLFG